MPAVYPKTKAEDNGSYISGGENVGGILAHRMEGFGGQADFSEAF